MEKPVDPHILAAIYTQNCENVRIIRSERIWFGNIYVALIAGCIAIMPTASSSPHHPIPAAILLGFMTIFSIVALLSSVNLIGELEQSLQSVRTFARASGTEGLTWLDEPCRSRIGRLQLRWVFPIFYALATIVFAILLIGLLATGRPL